MDSNTNPTLKKLTLELLRQCPNRCLHCSTSSSPIASDSISFEQVRRIISQALPLGLEKVILSGGEPLIYPDLLSLVEYLRGRGLKVVIYTSGSVLNDAGPTTVPERMLRALSQSLCSFNVSLHSSSASVHDKFMDTDGSWERAVGFLRTACDLKCVVDVHTVVTQLNCDRVRELARFLTSFPIRALRLLRLVPQGRAKLFFDELVVSESDWNAVGQHLSELERTELPFLVKLGAHIPGTVTEHSYECSLDVPKLLVEPNGSVSVCPALKGSRALFNAPSLRSTPLVQILTSEWRATVAALKAGPTCDCPAQVLYKALNRSNAEQVEALEYGQEFAK